MTLQRLALIAALPATLAAQAPKDTTLKREQLAPDVYLFRAPSDLDMWTSANSVVVINDRDVTVFDNSARPVTSRMVIAEIRKLTSKPVRTLINSHWHMDHWSGNDEYVKAFPGIEIIATTQTRDYMKRMRPEFFSSSVGVARMRASLDTAITTGKQRDGTALTPDARRTRERDLADAEAFAREVQGIPRVLPTLTFRDTLVFWRGAREFRLISATGDATGSTVMYLPAERILAMGDVLVRPEDGNGGPPWTTNSYSITPWLNSLRSLATLDAVVIVPGQGPALHDASYLRRTADVFAAIIDQVHAALESGKTSLAEIQPVVNVDSIGRGYTPGAEPGAPFPNWVTALVRKVIQESLDGVAR